MRTNQAENTTEDAKYLITPKAYGGIMRQWFGLIFFFLKGLEIDRNIDDWCLGLFNDIIELAIITKTSVS